MDRYGSLEDVWNITCYGRWANRFGGGVAQQAGDVEIIRRANTPEISSTPLPAIEPTLDTVYYISSRYLPLLHSNESVLILISPFQRDGLCATPRLENEREDLFAGYVFPVWCSTP